MADSFKEPDSDFILSGIDEIEESKSDVDEDLEIWDIDNGLPEGLHFFQTSTTAYKTGRKPRTIRAAYDHETSVMYVIFEDGTYYMYQDVPPMVWVSFKGAESKGKFMWNNGFDRRGPMGMIYPYQEVDMNKVSARRRSALTSNLEQARKRQEQLQGKRTVKTLYPKGTRYSKPNKGGF